MLSALLPTPAAEHPTVAGVAELAVSAVAENTDATGAAQFEKDFGGTAQHGPVGDDHDRLGGRGFDDVGDRGGDSTARLRPRLASRRGDVDAGGPVGQFRGPGRGHLGGGGTLPLTER